MMAPTARVLRDGLVRDLPAEVLVPGDTVLLEVGNNVPADVRLVEAASLSLNESSLTGESTPVLKDETAVLPAETPVADRRNCAFSGTVVTTGRAVGIVIATGMATEIGHIAELISSYEEPVSPLQHRMSALGRWLGIAAIIISAIVFIVGAATGRDMLELALTAVSLAVAAVPEGLPAVVVISLALGMQRMARRNALVRRLAAVETLGSATVIASDKTGTLTKGEMTVVTLYPGPDQTPVAVTGVGYQPEGSFEQNGDAIDPARDGHLRLLLSAASLCNDARLQSEDGRWDVVGDTTEGALSVVGAKAGLARDLLERDYPRLSEIPFSAPRRRMTTVHQGPNGLIAFHKGATSAVLEGCSRLQTGDQSDNLTDDARRKILAATEELASRGLRVLALAYRPLDRELSEDDLERDMTFLGLAGIEDPPREEAAHAVALCHQAGILPVMITGDHSATALAIGRQLAIVVDGDTSLTGVDLDSMSDEEVRAAANTVRIFARISPEQKVRIVEALRANGHIIAVTGDGVNDAPALKRADIGVAMGITGTDVAKEAADMIIIDDNFASIVAAVEEGRTIFDNIRNFVVFLVSANIGEIILIFGGIVAGLPIPLLAMQILWVNLVTDSLPALSLSLEPGDPDGMQRRPRPPTESVLTRPIMYVLAIRGAVEGAGALAVFVIWLYVFDASDDLARTVAFATIVVAELLEAHGSRSLYRTIIDLGLRSNPYVAIATLISFGALLIVLYVPALQEAFHTEALGVREWLAVGAVGFGRLLIIEGMKVSPWRLRPD
jgi:Ca2+-transporting ATPase